MRSRTSSSARTSYGRSIVTPRTAGSTFGGTSRCCSPAWELTIEEENHVEQPGPCGPCRSLQLQWRYRSGCDRARREAVRRSRKPVDRHGLGDRHPGVSDVHKARAGRDRAAAPLRRAAPLSRRRVPREDRRSHARHVHPPKRRGGDSPARRRRGADRDARPGLLHGRARPTFRAAVAGRRDRALRRRGAMVPTQQLRSLLVEEAELGERIMRALILRRVELIERGAGGPVIVGRAGDADVLRLENFLARNAHPRQRLDPDQDAGAQALLERFQIEPRELPIVVCPNGSFLRNPSESGLARCLGMVESIDAARRYDVAIVGAGPAGLAAAVYAASEGLSVLVLECRSFGGQAGASSRIENYLGFPTGITGLALMARAYNQAQKFGAEVAIPDEVVRLERDPAALARFQLRLANQERVSARAVLIACGAEYRRLGCSNLAEFEGSSVHYWASPLEARLCSEAEVALVGAGNSAGQAVVYLAGQAAKVNMLVRGASLEASMSRYLVERIAALPNVAVPLHCEESGIERAGGILEAA